MGKQIISPFYHIGIDLDFENIYSYCKFTESALEQEKYRFNEIYQEKVSKLNAEEKDNFDKFSIEVHWKLYDVFPTLQWHSIFNTAYTIFENHMNELCRIFGESTANELSVRDLNGQGIERAKLFLSKVIGIKNVFNSTEWGEIQNYSKVRNILVHTSGKLDLTNRNHKEIFDYAKYQPKLILYPDDPSSDWAQVTILPDFIDDALLSYRIFLGKICNVEL